MLKKPLSFKRLLLRPSENAQRSPSTRGVSNTRGGAALAKKKTTGASNHGLVRALAHPTRIQILKILSGRPGSPRSLSGELTLSHSNVAYHVYVLNACECLKLTRTERTRGANERFYRTTPRGVTGMQAWRSIPTELKDAVSGVPSRESVDKAVVALEEATAEFRAGGPAEGSPRRGPKGGQDAGGR